MFVCYVIYKGTIIIIIIINGDCLLRFYCLIPVEEKGAQTCTGYGDGAHGDW